MVKTTLSGAAERAETRVKQLCSLGLGGQAIIPALLKELHALAPSCANAFYWADGDYRITNLYFEDPSTVAWLYLSDFYDRRKGQFADALTPSTDCNQAAQWVGSTRQTDARRFYTLDLDAPIYGPLDSYNFMRVFVQDDNRVLGVLQLCRLKEEKAFSAKEQHGLAELAPFIAHGLTAPADGQAPLRTVMK